MAEADNQTQVDSKLRRKKARNLQTEAAGGQPGVQADARRNARKDHRRQQANEIRVASDEEARKIFCLGFNKTGTTSLKKFFEVRGLSHQHNVRWPRASYIPSYRTFFDARTYSDGEQSNFVNLKKWFPRSLFILNTRSELSWLRSRIKHVLRFQSDAPPRRGGKKAPTTLFEAPAFDQDFLAAPAQCIDRWLLDRRIYEARVRAFFEGRSEFIELRVTEDDNWEADIEAFMTKNAFEFKESVAAEVLHLNKRQDSVFQGSDVIQGYFELAEARIKAMGSETKPFSHMDYSNDPDKLRALVAKINSAS